MNIIHENQDLLIYTEGTEVYIQNRTKNVRVEVKTSNTTKAGLFFNYLHFNLPSTSDRIGTIKASCGHDPIEGSHYCGIGVCPNHHPNLEAIWKLWDEIGD